MAAAISQLKLLFCFLFILPSLSSAFFQLDLPLSKPKSNPLLPELESLIEASGSGLDKTLEQDVKDLMFEISKTRRGDQRESLTGKWELIFTTEKEINFFKTSWPFAKVSAIIQNLDLINEETVNNLIQFEGGGKFAVTGSSVKVDGDDEYDRVAFEFQDAVATVWGKEITLPPVGTGWFDTMYCDGKLRLSRDSRGDYSVFRKID